MRYLAPLLFLALIGCNSGIPSRVQPQEYAVYHAFLVHYAAKNPLDTEHLYTFDEVSGSAFHIGQRQAQNNGSYSRCISQEADNAFWRVNGRRYSLDRANESWRTLENGRTIPFPYRTISIPYTAIGFSRVFFDRSGSDAYFRAGVHWCNPGCSGYETVWHAVRAGNDWVFNPTPCGAVS